jgi:hypothetical protein
VPMHSRLIGKTLRLQNVPMPGLDEDAWATVSPMQPSIKKVAAMDSPVFSEVKHCCHLPFTCLPPSVGSCFLSVSSAAHCCHAAHQWLFVQGAEATGRRLTASPSLAAAGSLSDISSAQDGFQYMRATQPDGSSSESDGGSEHAGLDHLIMSWHRLACNAHVTTQACVPCMPTQPANFPIIMTSSVLL